jgi:hypothetical protein
LLPSRDGDSGGTRILNMGVQSHRHKSETLKIIKEILSKISKLTFARLEKDMCTQLSLAFLRF